MRWNHMGHWNSVAVRREPLDAEELSIPCLVVKQMQGRSGPVKGECLLQLCSQFWSFSQDLRGWPLRLTNLA
jgi:hypothetical protein